MACLTIALTYATALVAIFPPIYNLDTLPKDSMFIKVAGWKHIVCEIYFLCHFDDLHGSVAT